MGVGRITHSFVRDIDKYVPPPRSVGRRPLDATVNKNPDPRCAYDRLGWATPGTTLCKMIFTATDTIFLGHPRKIKFE